MTFQKGISGNPAGRPLGSKDKRTELRELLEPHAPALIQKAVDMALQGDMAAMKMCLDRLIPPVRAIEVSADASAQECYEDLVLRLAREENEREARSS